MVYETLFSQVCCVNFVKTFDGSDSYLQKVEDLRIWAPREFEFDIAFWGLTQHLGHFDIALQKLWYKNDVFNDIFGCSGTLTQPLQKWAPRALEIFCKYDVQEGTQI